MLMHILVILAHPSKQSFSHKLAEAYKEGAESRKHTVELLDLYRTKLQLGFLQPETKKEYEQNQPIRLKLQSKIAKADEIVIIHPLWWGGPPAILKNMIDQTFTPGFAYRHASAKKLIPERLNIKPRGLLRGRGVRLMVTADGQLWTNTLRLFPYLTIWHFYIVRFAGMRLKSFHLFDYMRRRDDLTRSKWLAKAHRIAMKTRI